MTYRVIKSAETDSKKRVWSASEHIVNSCHNSEACTFSDKKAVSGSEGWAFIPPPSLFWIWLSVCVSHYTGLGWNVISVAIFLKNVDLFQIFYWQGNQGKCCQRVTNDGRRPRSLWQHMVYLAGKGALHVPFWSIFNDVHFSSNAFAWVVWIEETLAGRLDWVSPPIPACTALP